MSNWLKFMTLLPRRRCFGGSVLERFFLKEGGHNTKYFHMTTLKHKMANRISRLNTDEGLTDNEEITKREAMDFFSRLLQGDPDLNLDKQNVFLSAFQLVFLRPRIYPSLAFLLQMRFLRLFSLLRVRKPLVLMGFLFCSFINIEISLVPMFAMV